MIAFFAHYFRRFTPTGAEIRSNLKAAVAPPTARPARSPVPSRVSPSAGGPPPVERKDAA